MSQLDDLLSRSRAPGRFVERRAFTLSREKAIEKQREFALRHPRQYLLELIQGAVFGGATYLAIDTRPHALLVAWVGGRTLAANELEGLFDYLFADRGDARWRHLVQLAIGINAILQRRPRTLRLESGDGVTAVRLDLDAEGRGTMGVPEEPIAGTYLYAEYGAGWFSRFVSGGPTVEQALVEERCLYTPVPILLNGSAPFGYRGGRHVEVFGAELQESFDEGGRRGVIAVHTNERAPTGFRIVVGGVWITTLPLAELSDRPLVGVVCDDRLRKTADQSDIVQDDRYVELLHALQPVATRLLRQERPGYRPPRLPPIPERVEPLPDAPPAPAAEALPEWIPCLSPREPVRTADLGHATDPETPWFWLDPSRRAELEGRATEPDRFPWRVLVLTEGEALTLAARLGTRPLHRLQSRADLDFVRRVVDRRARFREVTTDGAGFRVTARLHLEGPRPDWGHGLAGVPFCVSDDRGTIEHGVVDGGRIVRCGGRDPTVDRERPTAFPLDWPGVSLRVEGPVAGLDDAHLEAALAAAHALAVPGDGPPHRELLARLLGALAVPQFVHGPDGVRVGASLPPGWPDALHHVPLIDTDEGPLSWEGLAALAGTPEVRSAPSLPELLALDGVERRLGYGHLAHPALDATPIFGAARIGDRWTWLATDESWASPALTQVVWVAATFRPTDRDAEWRTLSRPAPTLMASARADATPEAWGPGWQVLFQGIQRVEAERDWSRHARGAVTAGRAEAMGRLALLALARRFGGTRVPLLVPTDGGGRRSLVELRAPHGARFVARHGVRLAEPGTFAVTRDELGEIEADGHPATLRYDDAPEVWRSLPGSEAGWLLREEVDQGGLRGWLGLRTPHDGTSGILLRGTGELVAQSELERAVPCHGLLWSADGATRMTAEQRRFAQLAGLRLYQALAAVLATERDPARAEAARRYATTFVLLAHRRGDGRLRGTAAELARQTPVPTADGRRAGTLADWLAAPPGDRPPIEPALLPPEEGVPEPAALAPPRDDLSTRLYDALGAPAIGLSIRLRADRPTAALGVDAEQSHRGRLVLWMDEHHPMVRAGTARPGPEREALLLELARLACGFGAALGLELDLVRTQQILLAQRLES